MNKEEFIKDLEHWTREEIINKAYEICCESIEQEEYIKYWQNEYDKKCEVIDKAIECINYYAIENEDYNKIYSDEEKDLLEILRGKDDE